MEYGMKGKYQGDMKPEVKDCQMPADAFSEKYNQSPLMYKERQDRQQSKAGNKLRGESFNGRYSK